MGDRLKKDIEPRYCSRCGQTTQWFVDRYLYEIRIHRAEGAIVLAREYCGECGSSIFCDPADEHEGWYLYL